MASGEPGAGLKDALSGLGAAPGCRIGLYARALEGPGAGREVGFFEDEPLPGASLVKVLILAELLRRAQAGLPLSQTTWIGAQDMVGDSEMASGLDLPARPTLRWLAEAMITASDNTATNVLIALLGLPEINALARGLGLTNTRLRRYMMDSDARARGEENLTSARDMAALLAELHGGNLLSPRFRGLALTMLLAQRQPPGLPMNLPREARPAYKPGDLEDVRNCAALALLPGRSLALAVLVHGDATRATSAVDAATRRACEHLSSSRAAGSAGPDIQCRQR